MLFDCSSRCSWLCLTDLLIDVKATGTVSARRAVDRGAVSKSERERERPGNSGLGMDVEARVAPEWRAIGESKASG